jgi:hypothetical protein
MRMKRNGFIFVLIVLCLYWCCTPSTESETDDYHLNPFTIIDSIRGPDYIPFGLDSDGRFLWHANRGAGDTIFKIDSDNGNVLESFASPGTDPSGISYANGFLWHSDWNGNMVYKIDKTTHAVVSSFTFIDPKCLEWDGDSLWIRTFDGLANVDHTTGAIRYIVETGYWIEGVSFDGTNFWITAQEPVEDGERTIKKMSKSGEILESYAWPRLLPGGLSWDGDFLWVSDYNGWIYQVHY